MKVALLFVISIAVVLAEPPVPNSQYLPSNQYGPPAQTTAVLRPNNQYGAPPNGQYGPPPTTPNGKYGPPPTVPNGQYGPPNGQYGPPGYGKNGDDDESEPANYKFEYAVKDDESGNDFGHEEERQGDVAKGKYYVLLPDGRRQVVEYIADNDGYKPKISYEQVSNGNGGYKNGGYPSNGNGGYPSNGNGNGGYPSNGGYQY